MRHSTVQSIVLLSFIYSQCHVQALYAEYHYAERRGANITSVKSYITSDPGKDTSSTWPPWPGTPERTSWYQGHNNLLVFVTDALLK